MISLALRLAVRGSRDAAARLVLIAAGVALGVALLLTAFGSYAGLRAQDARSGWLSTGVHNATASDAGADPLWWLKSHDEFHGLPITRIDLAAAGPHSPIPPGIPALPAPGQFYASPAMTRLLASNPADELGGRYPAHQVGVIGRAALASPNVLVIVAGDSVAQLADQPGAVSVRTIEAAPTKHNLSIFQEVGLGLGAAGLLFPILTLVAMATRIAAARREQRLAAMRLVGATTLQVAVIAAAEAIIAALGGALAGIGLFYLLRRPIAGIQLTGDTWYPDDLRPSLVAIVIVCVGVPLAAAAAAVAALRRVRLSPLGVTRRVTAAPPTAKRLIPLGIGALILGVFALAGRTNSRGASGSYAPTIVAGFVLTMAGIVVAGPWLTMTSTRLLALRSGHPATLIASRRLADDPASAFRAVSGLVLAVFVGSVFVAGTGTASRGGTTLGDDPAANATAIARPATAPLAAATGERLSRVLQSDGGVRGVTLVRISPTPDVNGFPQGLLDCSELAGTPEVGRCDPSATVAIMPLYSLDAGHTQPRTRWPAMQVANLSTVPIAAVVIATDGRPASLERVRTSIEAIAPRQLGIAKTVGQLSAASVRDARQLQHLGELGILLSVLIAGCSLAIAVAGSLVERRRPFAVLRLTGMPLRSLRQVVLLEAAVPLLALTVVSAIGGLITAELLLRALTRATLHLPGLAYYLTLLAGTVIALGLVAATLPLLQRISSPENARSE